MDWFDLLAVQGTLRSLLQRHSSKTSVLWHSASFIVQLSHSYMTTGKIIAFTIWTFVGKVMPLLYKMLSRFVIAFLPRSKCILVSWLQSPSTVILEPKPLRCNFINRKKCFPETNGELKAVAGFGGGEERDLRGKRKHTLGPVAAAAGPWGFLQILLCCGYCPEQ